MAKYVTRTVKMVKAEIMGLNTETAEIEYRFTYVSGKFDEAKAIKQARKEAEGTTFVPAKVANTEYVIGKYRMLESDFLAKAEQF